MKKPKTVEISIVWEEQNGNKRSMTTSNIDEALDMLGLLNGTVTEEDLNP